MRNHWLLTLVSVAAFSTPTLAEDIAPERAAMLVTMVDHDCGSCHGLTRKGGLGSPLTRDALGGKPAEGLAAVILDGLPGTAMPPWRGLLDEGEALWIAHLLKGGDDD